MASSTTTSCDCDYDNEMRALMKDADYVFCPDCGGRRSIWPELVVMGRDDDGKEDKDVVGI